ncbi:type VI secretion system ATPase TssH [Aporhodopirellula aestuarii]|uniref:Type VI secretion system ATPase TssH n=1 Tax=Aporhodopirellula aestuarii TaxID=2950107 RepID=A0ABT0TZ38_9BACT|nr:type VI secretion system ATPase TssH [Aporhodopirellula aestuarii]MCM2369873.1 type VI secretion system ATPase TssH [Aporhodopirellula aestuarii]
MIEISRATLFGKLNSVGYQSIEAATVFCKMRGNAYVELVHWIHQILQLENSDLHEIIRHFQIDPGRLAKDITTSLDKLPRGSTSISDFSPHIEQGVERGWVYGTLMFADSQVRTGYLIVGLLKTRDLAHALASISSEFSKIKIEQLVDNFREIVSSSPEENMSAKDGRQIGGGVAPGVASGAMAPAQMGKQEALQSYSHDLTEKARSGEMDPVIGRDDEIRQIVDILMRRRQNNPILTGEAGVGKTAILEGLAQRIVSGEVPPPLKEVSLRSLDVAAMQAGASMKGEFENRLKQVIEEVQSSEKPVILFIDEAHTLIGAGGQQGTGDAANLLKPALARGELRTIAATTWAEYKQYIEKDPALTRRFQVVKVDEPSEEKAIRMMRSMAASLEKHHKAQILDEAIEAAVKLSSRYIPDRQLPDKCVSLLDTACARVTMTQHSVPAEVEYVQRNIHAYETELKIIKSESAIGVETLARREAAEKKLESLRAELAKLESRWNTEKERVEKVLAIRARLRSDALQKDSPDDVDGAKPELSDEQRQQLLDKLSVLQSELAELQGENPLILPSVDEQAVAAVVADWTGIPVGRMLKDEIDAVLNMATHLDQRVIGQRHALEMVAKRVQTSRAGLDNPSKPIGVFMFCGPSGVGKTETALALSELLYGGEQNMITINMSEFQEAHTVSSLKGAPPGYVGYGEGGVLTEAVRRKPYSVVLLDEVEKAHPDVHEIFFQVFDKGVMEDGEGRRIDFRNTLILLTSNVGSDLIMNMCSDPELMPSPDGIAKALREPLLSVFPAALLGRIVTIPYFPLSDEMIGKITKLQLGRIQRRVQEKYRIPMTYDEEAITLIASRCTELESGGRMIDSILTNTVLPEISRELLLRTAEGREVSRVNLGVSDGEFAYAFDN